MKSFYNYGVWFCIFAIIASIFKLKNDNRVFDIIIKNDDATSSYKALFIAIALCILPIINWIVGITLAAMVVSDKLWNKVIDEVIKDDR